MSRLVTARARRRTLRHSVFLSMCLTGLACLGPAGAVRADDWSLSRPHPRGAAPRPRPDDSAQSLRRAEALFRKRPHDGALLERLVQAVERQPGGLVGLVAGFEEALRKAPDDALLAEATARLLQRAGQPTRARQALLPFTGSEPCLERLLLLDAELASALGSHDGALASQRRVLACSAQPAQLRAARDGLLATLLAQGAVGEARDVYRALTGGSRDPVKLRGFADALAARGLHQQAAAELLALAELSPRPVELLRDAAFQLLAAGDASAALEVLQRALPKATLALQAELSALEEECYRKLGRLPVLAERLDGSQRSPDRRRAARLWDELGDDARSEAAWRAWLEASPRDADALRSLARLMQRAGRREEAEATLRRLTQLAPHDPEALASYVELLRASGREVEAVALLTRAASSGPPALQLRVSELLAKLGQSERRRALLQRLIRLEPGNADHVVALGELELAEGDREAALRTWRTLLGRAPSRAAGLSTLSEILGDHGLVDEALATLEQALALSPDQASPAHEASRFELTLHRKQASLLERAGRGPAAESAWQWVLKQPSADPEAQREARAHLVSLWKRLGVIPMRARMLAERVRASTTDLEARRLLAEIFARDPQRAENELELIDRIASSSDADPEVLRALAALHIRRDDVGRALGLLERLAELVPEGALDNLARAVELSLTHYRDDTALRYADRAVALRPDDAAAHLLSAQVHRRLHQLPQAMAAYRRAVELKPTSFETRLQLAELAHATGDLHGACDGWLIVLAQAAADEQVTLAARRLMELPEAVLAGRLEQALLMATQDKASRPLFRRLLVEWYARGHRRQLALRPLLDSLDDQDASLRASAIALLAQARAAGTAQPLLSRVERMASRHEAAAALIAVGRIGDASAVVALRELLGRIDARLRPIALWALVALSPPTASTEQVALLSDGDASVRSMTALALGLVGDDAAAQLLRSQMHDERHPAVRAALLWALGRRPSEQDAAYFRSELSAPWPVSGAALFGLRHDRAQLAHALLGADLALRRAASGWWPSSAAPASLPVPSWPFDARAYVGKVVAEPMAARAAALASGDGRLLGEALRQHLREPALAASALAAFVGDGAALAPRALVERGMCPTAELTAAFWKVVEPDVAQLAIDRHAPAQVAALLLLARGGRAAHPAVRAALAGTDPAQRDPLLAALSDLRYLPPALHEPLLALFSSAQDWPTRLRVAPLLGADVGRRRQASEPVALVRSALVAPARPAPQLVCAVPAALN